MVVADRPGYLARSMTLNPTDKQVVERIYASEREGETLYRIAIWNELVAALVPLRATPSSSRGTCRAWSSPTALATWLGP